MLRTDSEKVVGAHLTFIGRDPGVASCVLEALRKLRDGLPRRVAAAVRLEEELA